jgi:two-component system NtrC family sensor kinase
VLIYDEGKEIATFGIFSDLRAMQKIEEDLEQTQQMLLQAAKMAGLGRLAAGVAHEINNPLSGIILYANFVLEELGQDHACVADVRRILTEAERCEAIVRDLLEFSHQSMTGRMVPVNVNDQVRRTLGTLLHQPLFYHVDLEYDLDRSLSSILGNPIKLNQVFMNILVNAAQAMNGMGRITISSRHRSHRDIVEVEIADSGPGIAPEILPRIFDPFFTTKSAGQGTGLGLSISYAIVKEHRGTIRAQSVPGQGTTFVLRFPAVQGTQAPEPEEEGGDKRPFAATGGKDVEEEDPDRG